MKKIWCRVKQTHLGFHYPKRNRFIKKYDQSPRIKKRWRCPDCGRRFEICTSRTHDGDIVAWGPPHKKRVK